MAPGVLELPPIRVELGHDGRPQDDALELVDALPDDEDAVV